MDSLEFSNEFDILFNNIMSNQAPGLDDYEKSVFLTKAQEELVISAYSGGTTGNSFESSEELRTYLASLVCTIKPTILNDSGLIGISPDSTFYSIDNDYMFITSEYVILAESDNKCISKKRIPVIPITQDEFSRVENNPFRMSSKRRVLRLDVGKDYSRVLELITPYNISEYVVRCVIKPNDIVIDSSVEGDNPCTLHPILHRKILDRAVLLAKASFVSNP